MRSAFRFIASSAALIAAFFVAGCSPTKMVTSNKVSSAGITSVKGVAYSLPRQLVKVTVERKRPSDKELKEAKSGLETAKEKKKTLAKHQKDLEQNLKDRKTDIDKEKTSTEPAGELLARLQEDQRRDTYEKGRVDKALSAAESEVAILTALVDAYERNVGKLLEQASVEVLVAQPDPHAMYAATIDLDQYRTENFSITVKNGLLSDESTAIADDRTGAILVSLAKIGTALALQLPLPVKTSDFGMMAVQQEVKKNFCGLGRDQKFRSGPFKYVQSFDPTDTSAVRRINEELCSHGSAHFLRASHESLETAPQDYKGGTGKDDVQVDDVQGANAEDHDSQGDPQAPGTMSAGTQAEQNNAPVTTRKIGGPAVVPSETGGGLFYRTLQPVNIEVFRDRARDLENFDPAKCELGASCPVTKEQVQALTESVAAVEYPLTPVFSDTIMIPNGSPTYLYELNSARFVQTTHTLKFDRGMLVSGSSVHPSPVEGGLNAALEVLLTPTRFITEIFQLRINLGTKENLELEQEIRERALKRCLNGQTAYCTTPTSTDPGE